MQRPIGPDVASIASDAVPLPLRPSSNLFLAAIARFRTSNEVLECRLRGGSMESAIPAGSRIRISFVDPGSYRVGQVVAFIVGDRICVHRIVHRGRGRRARNYLITQGDRCVFPDAPVAVDAVLGPITEFEFEGQWRGPGAAASEKGLRRMGSPTVRSVVAAGVEIDVRLARGLTFVLHAVESVATRAVARLRRVTRPA